MNAPPALVEAFLARLGRMIDGARELPRDRVLVRAVPDRPDPHAAEDMAAGGIAWAGPGGLLPLPFTVGMALDILTPEVPTVAGELAAEVHRLAVALVDPAVLDRVLEARLAEIVTGWPLPYREDGRIAYEVLDVLVTALWRPATMHDALYFGPPGSFRSRWPDVNPVAVAEWARPGVDRVTGNDYGSRMVRDMKRAETEVGAVELAHIGLPGFTLPPDRAGPRRTPGLGLALLYLAERAELPRVRATAAARLAFASVRALAGARDPGPLHFAALEAVLGEDGAGDLAGRVLADGATRARFAAELVTMARTVAERAFTGDAPEGEPEARTLARDVAEHFAAVLDGIDTGRAGDVRGKAAERAEAVLDGRELPGALWNLWTDPDAPEAPPRWLRVLARALWFGRWRPALARASRVVALPRAFVTSIDVALSACRLDVGTDGRPVVVNARGEGIAGWRPAGPVVTALEANMLETLARAGLPELARVAAVRFIPWFAHRVQRRPPWHDREPITFIGGAGQEGGALGALAAELGLRADRDGPAALAMLRALAALVLDYPNGAVSSLLSLDYHPGGPGRGRVSRLEITPGRPWFGHDPGLPDGAEHRALVPLPELPGHLPHFTTNNPRDRAGCARLYLHIMAEHAIQSDDLARGLGALVTAPSLVEWSIRLDVMRPPRFLVPAVLDDLVNGEVLVRLGPDRYHLHERFPAERALLEAGGRARIGATIGGIRAAEARQEARERLADGKGKGRSGKGRR